MVKKLSIVIASNRQDLIKRCLLSILNAKRSSEADIIVVDNTTKGMSSLNQQASFRIIKPPKTGLSYARNIGWQHAKGEYVAYIDDDAIANEDWVNNILKFIKKRPSVSAFGGPYIRHNNFKLPVWITDSYSTSSYGGQVKKLMTGYEWLNGTNMVFKRALLKELGGFNETLGMKGNKTSYGEETDLQLRIAQKGIDIWYDPNIQVSHMLPKRKTTVFWMLYDAYRRGRNFYIIKKKHPQFFKSKINLQVILSPTSNPTQSVMRIMQNISYAAGLILEKLKT